MNRRAFLGALGAGAVAARAQQSVVAPLNTLAVTSVNWLGTHVRNPGPNPFAMLSVPWKMASGYLADNGLRDHWNRHYEEYLENRNPEARLAHLRSSGVVLTGRQWAAIRQYFHDSDPTRAAADWNGITQRIESSLAALTAIASPTIQRAQIACVVDVNGTETCSTPAGQPTAAQSAQGAEDAGNTLGQVGAGLAGAATLGSVVGADEVAVGLLAIAGGAFAVVGAVLFIGGAIALSYLGSGGSSGPPSSPNLNLDGF